MDNGGKRESQTKEKDLWTLLPWDAIRCIVKVLMFGSKKYGKHNWLRGLGWTETADSALRHLTSWLEGEELDKDSGLHHLWHFGCNALFLITYQLRGIGNDNRVIVKKPE